MITINFFGGPSAGKSTAASGLYHSMKKQWISSEYVSEYVKDLIWAGSGHMLSEQNYIFGKQENRLSRLQKKVHFAVTDGPLLLSSFYAPRDYHQSFHQNVFDFFARYRNINFFINRSHDYSLEGRIQDEEQANELSSRMKQFLHQNGITFWEITASDANPDLLLSWIVEKTGYEVPLKTWKPSMLPENWITPVYAQQPWEIGRIITPVDLSDITTSL